MKVIRESKSVYRAILLKYLLIFILSRLQVINEVRNKPELINPYSITVITRSKSPSKNG